MGAHRQLPTALHGRMSACHPLCSILNCVKVSPGFPNDLSSRLGSSFGVILFFNMLTPSFLVLEFLRTLALTNSHIYTYSRMGSPTAPCLFDQPSLERRPV
jgi:hypothetical protein